MSLDWKTFSSEVGGILVLDDFGIPLEAQRQQMISMDPPRHDRLKALFQRGFTPKRIAEHSDRIRGIVNRTLDRVAERGECDLVTDVAGPVVSRVIGSFMGTPEEDDRATWRTRTSRSGSATRTCGRARTLSRDADSHVERDDGDHRGAAGEPGR